jgi:glutathione-regulated potassium-efflux system ancillary protein KefG
MNRALVAVVPGLLGRLPRLTFHDLYEAYPDFNVDVAREQALLLDHDVVVLHHPFYWYSAPPLVKQWEDLVLEHGWAYGAHGRMLEGKRLLSVVTLGGVAAAYRPEGYNRFTSASSSRRWSRPRTSAGCSTSRRGWSTARTGSTPTGSRARLGATPRC